MCTFLIRGECKELDRHFAPELRQRTKNFRSSETENPFQPSSSDDLRCNKYLYPFTLGQVKCLHSHILPTTFVASSRYSFLRRRSY